jgi:hypothetical protein
MMAWTTGKGAMVDIRTLIPGERARQSSHPDGYVDLAIAEGLNTINHGVNEAVFRRLRLQPGCCVLELDFGNGGSRRAVMP